MVIPGEMKPVLVGEAPAITEKKSRNVTSNGELWNLHERTRSRLFKNYDSTGIRTMQFDDPNPHIWPGDWFWRFYFKEEFEKCRNFLSTFPIDKDNEGDRVVVPYLRGLLENEDVLKTTQDLESDFIKTIQTIEDPDKLRADCQIIINRLCENLVREGLSNQMTGLLSGLVEEFAGILSWNIDGDGVRAMAHFREANGIYNRVGDDLRNLRARAEMKCVDYFMDSAKWSGMKPGSGEPDIGWKGVTPRFDSCLMESLPRTGFFSDFALMTDIIEEHLKSKVTGYLGVQMVRTPMGTNVNVKVIKPEFISQSQKEALEADLARWLERPKVAILGDSA